MGRLKQKLVTGGVAAIEAATVVITAIEVIAGDQPVITGAIAIPAGTTALGIGEAVIGEVITIMAVIGEDIMVVTGVVTTVDIIK